MKTFAERLRYARAHVGGIGLSAYKVARLAGVSAGYLSQLENGQRTPRQGEALARLAAALQVSPEWLRFGSNEDASALCLPDWRQAGATLWHWTGTCNASGFQIRCSQDASGLWRWFLALTGEAGSVTWERDAQTLCEAQAHAAAALQYLLRLHPAASFREAQP